jgi:hypothetical protein
MVALALRMECSDAETIISTSRGPFSRQTLFYIDVLWQAAAQLAHRPRRQVSGNADPRTGTAATTGIADSPVVGGSAQIESHREPSTNAITQCAYSSSFVARNSPARCACGDRRDRVQVRPERSGVHRCETEAQSHAPSRALRRGSPDTARACRCGCCTITGIGTRSGSGAGGILGKRRSRRLAHDSVRKVCRISKLVERDTRMCSFAHGVEEMAIFSAHPRKFADECLPNGLFQAAIRHGSRTKLHAQVKLLPAVLVFFRYGHESPRDERG